jgi:hypothetical protein
MDFTGFRFTSSRPVCYCEQIVRLKWGIVVVGILLTARIAVFMVDATKSGFCTQPWSRFYRTHCCLSAYIAGVILAGEHYGNVYDASLYDNAHIGPLELDGYEYPPTFLLLPRVALLVTSNFFALRTAWFFIEAALVLLSLVWVMRFARGSPALTALVWVAPPTLTCLQLGNFQVAAIGLAMLAMMAIVRGHEITGAALLAFLTAAKVYPGFLIFYLLVQRRWRACAWAALFGIGFIAATWWVFGSAPLVDFVRYQMPRLADGSAFPWMEKYKGEIAVQMAATNYSYYGLVRKLGAFGIPGMTVRTANRFAWVASIGILAATLVAARAHLEKKGPWHAAVAWLVLINLSSFRSPFCPDPYATFGTIWLLALVTPAARRPAWIASLVLAWLLLAIPWPMGRSVWPPPMPRLLITTVSHLLLLGVNVWALVRAARADASASASEPSGVLALRSASA